MTVVQRFKSGLNYGLNSFGILFKHPRLLLYLGAPILLGITFELIIYNLFFFSGANTSLFVDGITMHIWSTFGWARHIGIFVTSAIRLFTTIFATVALMNHVDALMQGQQSSFVQCIKKAGSLWKQIVAWSLIATTFFTLINPVDEIINTSHCASCYRLAFFVSASLRLAWSLLTAFVVSCIALENMPLSHNIMVAPRITKKIFFEFLGGLCWLGLIIILGTTPLLLFKLSSHAGQSVGYVIIALGSVALSTAYVILQVSLYRTAKNSSLWEKIITFPPL